MSRDRDWLRAAEPKMDGSHTLTVAKYHDGRPGIVTVTVPSGYELVKVGEVERLRSVIDRCPFDETPLQHDDENPQLAWWCGTCGHITDRPSALAVNQEVEAE